MSDHPVNHSVVRRSLLVVGFVVMGQGFNYVLVLVANRTIDATAFGRFYAAWAALNILVTPGVVLALLVTRYYADVFRAQRESGIPAAIAHASRMLAPWVAGAVLAMELALYLAGRGMTDSVILVFLLPVTAASVFAVEVVRAALAAMLRATLFGGAFFVWCGAQCALALLGLFIFRTVWSAYAGVLAANLLTLALLIWFVLRLCRSSPLTRSAGGAPMRLELSHVLPFCSAYVGFVVLNNVDIVIAYFLFNGAQLGAYSAAAVLPKAIVTVTQPIAQIILPLLVAVEGQAILVRKAVLKAVAVTFAIGAAAAAVLGVASQLVCGGRFGVRYCEPSLMMVLATAAVFLAIVRVAITADLGQRLYWVAQVPFLACLVFAGVELVTRPSRDGLALSYMLASLGTLVAFSLLSAVRMRLRSTVPARQPT